MSSPARPRCRARRGRARPAGPTGRGRASSARRTCRTGRRAPGGAAPAPRRGRPRAGEPFGPERPRRLGIRREQGLDHGRHGGHASVGYRGQRGTQGGALAWQERSTEAGAGQRRQQLHLPAQGSARTVECFRARVERVEPNRPPGSQRHRPHTPGRRQVAVLPFGIDHPGSPAEHGLPPQEGLDERALAPADLAEDDHVRVGHHALVIELEGVEHEGAAQQVVADDHAALSQPRLGDERVGRPEIPRRHLMGRHPGPARRTDHVNPRPSGNVQV